ncbi:GIY-YIG nuclease family protein [Compostibacter hankyongensis]|uniref:GIY-YIG nuclease family protein n=1 Tax=Compostibacter hankyongensis TaxID=1007089 RepID=UPI003CD061F6
MAVRVQVPPRALTYYAYTISSPHRNYVYVGASNNLKRRIDPHNKEYQRTTKPFPLLLNYLSKLSLTGLL